MSIEQDKNKAMLDDEKFIDCLYAQLKQEANNAADGSTNNSLFDEQPSITLDKKILAAAHKSVGAKATVTNMSKPRAWYIPVGIAASTVLAVSLIINQTGEVLVSPQSHFQFSSQPSAEIMPSATDNLITEQADVALAAKARSIETMQVKALKEGKSSQVEKSARAAFYRAKKNASREVAQLTMADEKGVSGNNISAVQPLAPAKRSNAAEATSQLSADLKQTSLPAMASEAKNITVVPWLSSKQYQLFLPQKRLWSPITESDKAYLISIFNSSEQVQQYKLSKKVFYISHFSDQQTKKLSLTQIQIITASK